MIKNLRNHNTNGFTLIEVMVVLIIMSIITTVALLSLHLFSQSRQVTVAAEQLKQTLDLAENEALLRPCILGLKFTSHGFQFYVYQLDKHHHPKWITLPHDALSRPNAFANGIKVYLIKSTSDYIVFSPNGTVSPFSLLITDKKQDRRYTLSGTDNGLIHFQQTPS